MAIITDPLISIIVPTYNRADRIEKTLRSILDQDYQRIDVVVVDDASTDETEEVILGIGDERIRYIKQSMNAGAAAARNRGLDEAKGEVIGFIDSDDVFSDYTLFNKVVELSGAKSVLGCVWVGWEWVEEGTGTLIRQRLPDATGLVDGFPRWVYNIIPGVFFRREMIGSSRFDPSMRARENYDFLLRTMAVNDVIFTEGVGVTCYHHKGERNSSQNASAIASDYKQILRQHSDILSANLKAKSKFHKLLGMNQVAYGNSKLEGWLNMLYALKLNRSDLKIVKWLLITPLPRNWWLQKI